MLKKLEEKCDFPCRTCGTILLLQILSFLLLIITSPSVNGQAVRLPNLSAYLKERGTISGLGSGGTMATQLHLAHSANFSGVAMFAAPFYRYWSNEKKMPSNRAWSLFRTTKAPKHLTFKKSLKDAIVFENLGDIDPLSNLKDSKIFLWYGEKDEKVHPAMQEGAKDFYSQLVNGSNIRTISHPTARHIVPTDDVGGSCDPWFQPSDYLSNCSYSGSYEALAHMYGRAMIKRPPHDIETGLVIFFKQGEFTYPKSPEELDFAETGTYYLPSDCEAYEKRKCKFHIFFHDCFEKYPDYPPEFARRIGLLRMAEENDIIMLFPRAAATVKNPHGCWHDGLIGPKEDYATKNAPQIKVVMKMVERMYGLDAASSLKKKHGINRFAEAMERKRLKNNRGADNRNT